LRAEPVRAAGQQRRVAHRRAVDAHLVRSGGEERVHVVALADAAPDRERDEDLLRGPRDHVARRGAAFHRRRDVEEHQLVGAFPVVLGGELDGVAGVSELAEPHALHDATSVDVEARDHAFRQHLAVIPS
jgi:hypothetical protein